MLFVFHTLYRSLNDWGIFSELKGFILKFERFKRFKFPSLFLGVRFRKSERAEVVERGQIAIV